MIPKNVKIEHIKDKPWKIRVFDADTGNEIKHITHLEIRFTADDSSHNLPQVALCLVTFKQFASHSAASPENHYCGLAGLHQVDEFED